MLKVYSNAGMSGQHIGTCENGRVYREEPLGRTEIGSYENGNVYSGTGYTKQRVGGYDDRTIYQNGFFDDAVGEVDSNGNAYDGTDLFKDVTGRKIRDVGAVAAAQLLFPGCYYEEDRAGNGDDVPESASGAFAGNDDSSAASFLLGILETILAVAWKLIKTIPFWGPYGSILLLFTIRPVGSEGSISRESLVWIVLFYLAYLILHTILLFKCKKWEAKHKYWPIYVGFALLVITLVPLWAIPAVAFQIGALIYMMQKRKTNDSSSSSQSAD